MKNHKRKTSVRERYPQLTEAQCELAELLGRLLAERWARTGKEDAPPPSSASGVDGAVAKPPISGDG